MYITIYILCIYIYRFVHFASFVVPRGLGTHVTSLKRKEKKKKKKSGNPFSLAARTYPILITFYVLRYIYVYVCTREHARVSVVEAACDLQALESTLHPPRFKVHSRIGSRSGFTPRSLVLRDGCLSKLPRKV